MSTPFQTYLLEAIKKYDTPLGFYYDPIRDQSVKGDDPYFSPNEKPNLGPRPDLGPRPEFDWEVDILNNDPNIWARVLIHLLGDEYPRGILGRVQGILFKLPENVEDWQEYFDRVIARFLKPLGFLERGALALQGGIEGIIETIVGILNDLLDNPVGGSEYLQWHFNQYLQQLLDFLDDYEYGG